MTEIEKLLEKDATYPIFNNCLEKVSTVVKKKSYVVSFIRERGKVKILLTVELEKTFEILVSEEKMQ